MADIRSGQTSGWSVLVNVANDILYKSQRPLDQNRSGSRRIWVYLLRVGSVSGSKKVTRACPTRIEAVFWIDCHQVVDNAV